MRPATFGSGTVAICFSGSGGCARATGSNDAASRARKALRRIGGRPARTRPFLLLRREALDDRAMRFVVVRIAFRDQSREFLAQSLQLADALVDLLELCGGDRSRLAARHRLEQLEQIVDLAQCEAEPLRALD